jgi:hypothetical protein
MALIQFVQNFEDLSTDKGYQFSSFATSAVTVT